jgi:hypothetical protein
VFELGREADEELVGDWHVLDHLVGAYQGHDLVDIV